MQYYHMALVDHHKVPKFGLDMQSSPPNTHQSTALPCHPAILANTTRLSRPQRSLEHVVHEANPQACLGTSRLLPTHVRTCSPGGPPVHPSLGEAKLVNPTDADRGRFRSWAGQDALMA